MQHIISDEEYNEYLAIKKNYSKDAVVIATVDERFNPIRIYSVNKEEAIEQVVKEMNLVKELLYPKEKFIREFGLSDKYQQWKNDYYK